MVIPSDQLVEGAWNQSQSMANVPFERLEPRWKVLEVDRISSIRNDFNTGDYALTVSFSLNSDSGGEEEILTFGFGEDAVLMGLQPMNRDQEKFTTLVITGVTAVVRATAYAMEREGITYPARDIGEWLCNADLTHINNVLSFASDFPYPDPTDQFRCFCSNPSYIALLEDFGTDIVEVTGHRLADLSLEATRYTLDLYQEHGWNYYGGGCNLMDAREPRIVEHNGNRLAFVGCYAKGGGYVTASETQPGAVPCEFDWLLPEVTRLWDEGYLVIITFQHEEDYSFTARPELVADFQSVAAAGAVIVSGSQLHNPQGMEFYEGSFLHFGLGNLFFDQYNYCTEQICNYTMIDRHVFYDGRYIANELLTAQFEDYARSRPMTPNEREALLNKVFEASGW